MSNQNIVIFSSGVSEQSGVTESIKSSLNSLGYSCTDWRGLFAGAHDSNNIALLPMLIKKIPTFDFAILICEGHDITQIFRGENSETQKTMRDNVLFEIGLCSMALGLNRTILLTDRQVRLPDDLMGTHGQLAIKQIFLPESKTSENIDIKSTCEQIDYYIKEESGNLNQIVIGAAASAACGYVSNFICRTLEHIHEGIEVNLNEEIKKVYYSPEQIHLHIILPNNLDQEILKSINQKKSELTEGCVPTARSRPASFHCYLKDEELHIVDYPTNVVTSYDTALMILEMDADDDFDKAAVNRFVAKEMSLYETTLKSILNETFVRQVISEQYCDLEDDKKEYMVNNIMTVINNGITITRYET